MKTLQYLNGVAITSVNYTDNRPSGVIFDRPQGKSYSFTENSLSFPLLVGGNIVEIINPVITNVRYKINLGSVDASLSYAGLPGGVTVSQSGTIFTYFGIDSIVDWEAVKQPTIVIDPLFQGTFSYEASIVYNTDTTADNEFTWTVGIYVPISQMQSETQINLTPKYFRGLFSNMQSVSTLFVQGTDVLPTQFILTTNAVKNAVNSSTLSSSSAIFAKPRQFTFADSTVTINNPNPVENSNFGQWIAVDGSNQYVITSGSGFSVAPRVYIYNIETAELLQTITNTGTALVANGNWLLIQTTNTISGIPTFSLYKRQLTGDPYVLIENLTKPYDPYQASWGLAFWKNVSSNYLVLRNGAEGQNAFDPRYYNNYEMEVYSIDETNGFTYLYTKQGTGQINTTFTSPQRLGDRTAISDSYLCLAERTFSNNLPRNNIFVYETSTGNSLFTIPNNIEVTDMLIQSNMLYVKTISTLLKWNLSTNTQVYNSSLAGRRIEKYVDQWIGISINNSPSTSINIINENTANIESSISIAHYDMKFAGPNTIIIGDAGYDGVAGNQGIIYIKKET